MKIPTCQTCRYHKIDNLLAKDSSLSEQDACICWHPWSPKVWGETDLVTGDRLRLHDHTPCKDARQDEKLCGEKARWHRKSVRQLQGKGCIGPRCEWVLPVVGNDVLKCTRCWGELNYVEDFTDDMLATLANKCKQMRESEFRKAFLDAHSDACRRYVENLV